MLREKMSLDVRSLLHSNEMHLCFLKAEVSNCAINRKTQFWPFFSFLFLSVCQISATPI